MPAAVIGIRSVSEAEVIFIKKADLGSRIFIALEILVEKIIKQLSDRIYLIVDIDGFDSFLVSGTDTPEPGRLTWCQVTNLLK